MSSSLSSKISLVIVSAKSSTNSETNKNDCISAILNPDGKFVPRGHGARPVQSSGNYRSIWQRNFRKFLSEILANGSRQYYNAKRIFIFTLDKAKIATLAPGLYNTLKETVVWMQKGIATLKTPGRNRSRTRQPKSFTCIKFHPATRHSERKYFRWFLEGKLDGLWLLFNRHGSCSVFPLYKPSFFHLKPF